MISQQMAILGQISKKTANFEKGCL